MPSSLSRLTRLSAAAAFAGPRVPPTSRADYVVGSSPPMLAVFDQVRRFARCDAAVLITGASGTGKALVARAIHQRSALAAGPFASLDCGSLPPPLLASELLGYEKGAFAGAVARRRGLIETAHKGSLFLDEVGRLPPDLQVRLLRFVEDGAIVRLGGHDPVRVRVRLLVATVEPLTEAVGDGRFRADPHDHLNILAIALPALRERGDDLELLARYFLSVLSPATPRPVTGFRPAAIEAINAHDWPGNVRELVATIRRAIVLSDGPLIDAADLRLPARLQERVRSGVSAGAPIEPPPCPAGTGQRRGMPPAARDPAGGPVQRHQRLRGTRRVAGDVL